MVRDWRTLTSTDLRIVRVWVPDDANTMWTIELLTRSSMADAWKTERMWLSSSEARGIAS